MKAMVLTHAHKDNFRLVQEELQMPIPNTGEVLVKTRGCGVCHTDLHVIKAEVSFPTPAVLGHEISGEIVQFGPNSSSSDLSIGDRCISPFIMPCGSCHHCVRGKEDLCETFFKINRGLGTLYDGKTRLFRKDGTPIWMYSMAGLAEYCVVPLTAVFKLPKSINHPDAAILGCAIFTAYGAMKNAADMRAGDNIAVIGAGGVGINCLQIARAFGADKIIAIDISDDKLKACLKLGATHIINSKKENVNDKIKEYTNGRGVEIAVECLGNPITFKQTVDAVVDGGKAVMVGIAPTGIMANVEITKLVRRQIKILGSYGAKARQDVPAILRLVEKGFVDVSSPITRRYSLDKAGDAYADLNKGLITGRAVIDFAL